MKQIVTKRSDLIFRLHSEMKSIDINAVASCLSTAFSSGIWEGTPMPVGDKTDPDSAEGVIHELGPEPVVVAAVDRDRVLACALGAVLTEPLIARYRLRPWGAEPGDGLLAFVGSIPEVQGLRVSRGKEGCLKLTGRETGLSLARMVFATWLDVSSLAVCPRLFVRTRPRIGAVRHLCTCFGFEETGSFQVHFRGERQTRLVYRRVRSRPVPASGAT